VVARFDVVIPGGDDVRVGLVRWIRLVPPVQQLADPERDIRPALDRQTATLAEVVLHIDHDQRPGHRNRSFNRVLSSTVQATAVERR
jgi:hypothetical protein